jgi:hypothetical protein
MPERSEVIPVATSSFQAWLQQGEQLYTNALNEFRALEQQLEDLEARLAAKQAEVNQIATVIGKPPVEGSRRLSAELVPSHVVDEPILQQSPNRTSANATIARALTGKFGR